MTAKSVCRIEEEIIKNAHAKPERWPFITGVGDDFFRLSSDRIQEGNEDGGLSTGYIFARDVTIANSENRKKILSKQITYPQDSITLLVYPHSLNDVGIDVKTYEPTYELAHTYTQALRDTYSLFESPAFAPHPPDPPNKKDGERNQDDVNSWRHHVATVGYVLDNIGGEPDLTSYIKGYTDIPLSNDMNLTLLRDFTAKNIKARGHLNVELTLDSEFRQKFKNDVALKEPYIEDYITASMTDYSITTLRTEGVKNLNTGEKVNYFSHGNVWKVVIDPSTQTETETITSSMAIRSDNAQSQITALSYLNGAENYTILSSGNMTGNLFLSGVTKSRNENNQYSLISGDYPSSEHSSVQYHADRNCYCLWANAEGANQRFNTLHIENDTLNSAGVRKSHTLSIMATITEPYLANNRAIQVTNETGTKNYLQTTSSYDTYEDEHELIDECPEIVLPTPTRTVLRKRKIDDKHCTHSIYLQFDDGYEILLGERKYELIGDKYKGEGTKYKDDELTKFQKSYLGEQRRRNKRLDELKHLLKQNNIEYHSDALRKIPDNDLLSDISDKALLKIAVDISNKYHNELYKDQPKKQINITS